MRLAGGDKADADPDLVVMNLCRRGGVQGSVMLSERVGNWPCLMSHIFRPSVHIAQTVATRRRNYICRQWEVRRVGVEQRMPGRRLSGMVIADERIGHVCAELVSLNR